MGKLILRILGILIVILSISNFKLIYDYRMDKSLTTGTSQQLDKKEVHVDKINGYSITYNLDGGICEVENPTHYGMFDEDFSLNKPTKTGFKFIGWTGSNGSIPQLIVTICTGSEGDLEFTANYEAKTFIKLENDILIWQIVNASSEYEIFINDELVKITNETQIDLLTLTDYLVGGDNLIYIKSNGNKTSVVNYYFYNLEDFNDYEIECIFEVLSDGYLISYKNEEVESLNAKIIYDFSGNIVSYKFPLFPDDMNKEEFFLRVAGPNYRDYNVSFTGTTLFEILKQAHNNYSEDREFYIYDISENIEYKLGDSSFKPESLKLKLTYGEIYSGYLVYENANIDLSKTKSRNRIMVVYTPNHSKGYTFSSQIDFYIEDKILYTVDFDLNIYNNDYKASCTLTEKFETIHYSSISIADLLNVKFYLNDSYSFMFKSEEMLIKFGKDLTLNAMEQRELYEIEKGNDGTKIWTSGEQEYEFNVTEYFKVVDSDNNEITYPLNLFITFMTTCNSLLIYK